MARFKSPWEFLGLTGQLQSLFKPIFKISLIFWQEILHIGTLRARYRAEYRNVSNATASSIGDGGETHVAYEDGDEEEPTKRDLRDLLEAYGKKLFKEKVHGILPAFNYLENRLTGNSNYMFKCDPSYLICDLVQLFEPSMRVLSNSSRWGEAGPHGAIAARPAH
jgi:hypothetical protein